MVFINPPLSSPTERNKNPQILMENLSKKRKFYEDEPSENGDTFEKSLFKTMKSMPITDLRLESPLPLEWQRCLDIKSGQIYFYNTRTHKRTSSDPRLNQEEPTSPSTHIISLDLELNLTSCPTPQKNDIFTNALNSRGNTTPRSKSNPKNPKKNINTDTTGRMSRSLSLNPKNTERNTNTNINTDITGRMSRSPSLNPKNTERNTNTNINTDTTGRMLRSPSWLAFEGYDEDQEEMVAAVCNKCHMLVIMCKTSPSCPNCKFMHASNYSTTLFKRRSLSLLC